MTGYSDKPLAQKLGIKPGMTLVVLNCPNGYKTLLGDMPGVRFTTHFDAQATFMQFFSTRRSELERILPTLKRQLLPSGMLWISWPKKTSGVKTDLDENSVRDIGLQGGLVDVKVCAVDDTWSALKFVFRKQDR